MPVIEVDFDVFKTLTALRTSEEVAENDVLREVFKMPPKQPTPVSSNGPAPGDLVVKSVRFPAGTQFRGWYKQQWYTAKVENGALMLNGKSFSSVSAAAKEVTGTPKNGWDFWEYCLPGKSAWQSIDTLRPKR